jgi:hypothetical protein
MPCLGGPSGMCKPAAANTFAASPTCTCCLHVHSPAVTVEMTMQLLLMHMLPLCVSTDRSIPSFKYFRKTSTKVIQDLQVRGVPPAMLLEQQDGLLEAAAPLQHAHLAASLARISDAVTAAFPGGNRALPSSADLQKCIA